MSKPNILTFDWLRKADYKEILQLSPDELKHLQDDVAERSEQLKLDSKLLSNTLEHRFGNLATESYKIKGEDTGTVTIDISGAANIVKANRAKSVTWDQAKLENMYKRIAESGDQPEVYVQKKVTVTYVISENAFKTWPIAIQKVFSSARTISAGSTSYKIEPRKE